jgi:hypothetical protein
VTIDAQSFVVFAGAVRLAAGGLAQVAGAARRHLDRDPNASILVFNRQTAEVTDLDLRGDQQAVVARHTPPLAAKRGRPKLGVVSREITLLPRHWDWLARQPGGASTTLRRLVEMARRADSDTARDRSEAAYRFMSVMAGDLPGFEEAARALFAGDRGRLVALVSLWPADIGDEVFNFLGAPAAEGAGGPHP